MIDVLASYPKTTEPDLLVLFAMVSAVIICHAIAANR